MFVLISKYYQFEFDFYLQQQRLNDPCLDTEKKIDREAEWRGEDRPRMYITRAGRKTEDTVNPGS